MKFKFQAKYADILAKFMAKEDIRYYLNGIRVEPAPPGHKGVVLAATDGHAMVLIHDAHGEIDGFDPAVHTGCVKLPAGIISAAKKWKRENDLLVAFNGTHLSVGRDYLDFSQPSELDLHIHPSNPLVTGNYPKYAKLLPNFENLERGGVVGSCAGINPRLLSKFSIDGYGGLCGITLWNDKGGNQMSTYVQIEGWPEILGVVMSMRCSSDHAYEDSRKVWKSKGRAA